MKRFLLPYQRLALALPAIAVAALLPASLLAADPPVAGPVISKYDRAATSANDVSGQSIGTGTSPALYWYDGDRKRALIAGPQTSSSAPGQAVVTTSAISRSSTEQAAAMKALKAAGKQATFVNADGSGRMRTLPGGVVVTLAQPTSAAELNALLESFATQVLRPVGSDGRVWLVQAEAGLDALMLANTIHESRKVLSASPNWATARKLK